MDLYARQRILLGDEGQRALLETTIDVQGSEPAAATAIAYLQRAGVRVTSGLGVPTLEVDHPSVRAPEDLPEAMGALAAVDVLVSALAASSPGRQP